MNTEELIELVRLYVKDESFDTDEHILPALNEGLLSVSRQFCLPFLETSEDITVAIGTSSAPLPANYHHDMWQVDVLGAGQRNIRVHTSLHSLHRIHEHDRYGWITDVAVDGPMLHLRPVPGNDQQLRLWYYRLPEVLVETSASTPAALPADLHSPLLVNYASARLYAIIEDGVDGQMTNTAKHEGLYQEALLRLERYARPAPRHTPFIKRHAGWF